MNVLHETPAAKPHSHGLELKRALRTAAAHSALRGQLRELSVIQAPACIGPPIQFDNTLLHFDSAVNQLGAHILATIRYQ
jgi:hypothetical protein